MKKKIINIIAILTLMASFVLPTLAPQNAWAASASELKSACETLGGSFNVSGASSSGLNWHCNGAKSGGAASSSEISAIQSACSTLGKNFRVNNANASGIQWTCSGSTSSVKLDGDDSNNSNGSNGPNSGNNGSESGGGGTSPTAASSNATTGATESSPDQMNKECGEGQVKTSILGGGGCVDVEKDGGNIFKILNTILTVLTFGVGIAGTLGIVISGVQYLTAKDNEQQVVKAKSRLINIAIGLAAYAMMWALLQWLIPGGILNGTK